jgi:uncharacterized Zn finger protein
MSEVFGWDIEGGIVCPKCGEGEAKKEEAEAEGYPDGYTCMDCGTVIGGK